MGGGFKKLSAVVPNQHNAQQSKNIHIDLSIDRKNSAFSTFKKDGEETERVDNLDNTELIKFANN